MKKTLFLAVGLFLILCIYGCERGVFDPYPSKDTLIENQYESDVSSIQSSEFAKSGKKNCFNFKTPNNGCLSSTTFYIEYLDQWFIGLGSSEVEIGGRNFKMSGGFSIDNLPEDKVPPYYFYDTDHPVHFPKGQWNNFPNGTTHYGQIVHKYWEEDESGVEGDYFYTIDKAIWSYPSNNADQNYRINHIGVKVHGKVAGGTGEYEDISGNIKINGSFYRFFEFDCPRAGYYAESEIHGRICGWPD